MVRGNNSRFFDAHTGVMSAKDPKVGVLVVKTSPFIKVRKAGLSGVDPGIRAQPRSKGLYVALHCGYPMEYPLPLALRYDGCT